MSTLTEPSSTMASATSWGIQGADSVRLAEAVTRAQAGEVAAFESLYRACVGRVHATCLRMHGGRTEDAEDTVQVAFVSAWRRLPSFRGDSGFPTWLHRIAVNAALDRIRSEKSRGGVAGSGSREANDAADMADRIPDRRSRSPEAAIDLERALLGLPERARLAFVLHDIEGYKHAEIAEMTGTAEGTWKSQLHRARRLLREALER